jgi:hypothetical protein
MKIKEFCLGHRDARKKECYECEIDSMNRLCDSYVPIFLEDFNLIEKPKVIPYEHLGCSCEDDCDEEFYRRFRIVGREDDNDERGYYVK